MEIIKIINDIQNENTEKLAESIINNAQSFKTTKNYQQLINILRDIDAVLLTNGIFLREVLDVLDDIDYSCDNSVN